MKLFAYTLLAATALTTTAMAQDAAEQAAKPTSDLQAAIAEGNFWLDARYRFEHVEVEGTAEDANASTLRLRAGYETGEIVPGLKVLAEAEVIENIGDDMYNSTTNNKANRPTVADPTGAEVNRLQLTYEGIENTKITAGRQYINFDGQRFVGAVGWRQNSQTFDAARVDYDASDIVDGLKGTYAYVTSAQRINGNGSNVNGDHDHDSHLINISYDAGKLGKVVGYAYLLDNENSAANSSATYGLSYTGKHKFDDKTYAGLHLEAATQSDYGNNTADYDENYYHAKLWAKYAPVKVAVGYETLGGDGTNSFRTPLATGHKYNGWADLFLTTPGNGLEDLYFAISAPLDGLHPYLADTKAKLVYHDFSAEETGADYGSEWNAVITKKFMQNYMVQLKYADYQADTFGNDTQKIWFSLGAKF